MPDGSNPVVPDAPLDSGGATVVPGWSSGGLAPGHGCGIHDSKLYCWGDNTDGLVGAGSGTESQLGMTQLGSDLWLRVSVSLNGACAIRADHTLWCWGNQLTALLDDTQHFTPQQFPGTWKEVSVEERYACALADDGKVSCWGIYPGVGTTPGVIEIDGATSIQLSTGGGHACELHDDHTIWCFGGNSVGELGTGSTTGIMTTPIQFGAGTWRSVAAGNGATCAVTSAGQLRCVGRRLGDRSTPLMYSTVVAPKLSGGVDRTDWTEVAISTTGDLACATRMDGSLWCWGSNWQHHVSSSDELVVTEPTKIEGGAAAWSGFTANYGEWCGFGTDASMWCRGYDGWGELGDGGTSAVQPRQIAGTFSAVAAADQATCALATDGTLGCSGQGDWGQLANGVLGTERQTFGTAIAGPTWTDVSGGGLTFCGHGSDGSEWCWGSHPGISGQTFNATPTQISMWKSAAPHYHSCAIDSNDHATCWGTGSYGDTNACLSFEAPLEVAGSPAFSQLVSGYQHTCGLTATGAQCWGGDYDHQLGDNQTTASCAPRVVAGNHAFVKLGSGAYQTCGIVADGTTYCWGYNYFGQVGIGTTTDAPVPSAIATRKFSEIAGGWFHTCGVELDGTMWCWGRNERGQLGDGTRHDRSTPVQVGTATNWAHVRAGYEHTCALTTTGELWCWGSNDRGELADGRAWNEVLTTVPAP